MSVSGPQLFTRQQYWSRRWGIEFRRCVNDSRSKSGMGGGEAIQKSCEAEADEGNGWGMRKSAAWKKALDAIAKHTERYLRSIGGSPLVDAIDVEGVKTPLRERFFVWAGVHREDSWHVPHVHTSTSVVGTLYLSVPLDAGPITFGDPRRVWGEQEQGVGFDPDEYRTDAHAFETDLSLQPESGMIVLFPPWLSHFVGRTASAQPGVARVALSFNMRGTWGPLASATAESGGKSTGSRLEKHQHYATGARSRHSWNSTLPGASFADYIALLKSDGRLGEAEPAFRSVLAGDRKAFGLHHPETLVAIENLLSLLMELRKYADAEVVAVQLLQVRLTTEGVGHTETEYAVQMLRQCLEQQGLPTTKADRIIESHNFVTNL